MIVHKLEYKRLMNQLNYAYSEIELISETLPELYGEFEDYYNNFLDENELSKKELEKTDSPEFVKFKEEMKPKLPETDETGISILEEKTDSYKEGKKAFTKLYREIVKKAHPDKIITEDPFYRNELTILFKGATYAMDKGKWSKLLKIAEDLGVKPPNYKEINRFLKKEVEELNNQVELHKRKFCWRLYEAEEKEEKDKVIQNFIQQLFGRKV
jgi:hypothetical protein